MFKGKFFMCSDRSKMVEEECQGHYIVYTDNDINYPVVEERVWDRNSFHFDDVFKGVLTLFIVCTFEGWPGCVVPCITSI